MCSFQLSSPQKCVLIVLVAASLVVNAKAACTQSGVTSCLTNFMNTNQGKPNLKELCNAAKRMIDCYHDVIDTCPANVKADIQANYGMQLDQTEKLLNERCAAGLTSCNLWVLLTLAIFGAVRHFL